MLTIKRYESPSDWFLFDATGRHLLYWVGFKTLVDVIEHVALVYPDKEYKIVDLQVVA